MDWKTCFKEKKILVAEDDPVNQELMRDIFQQMNCNIEIAKDGSEAVEKAKAQQYDLILMDIRMPNKDGIQAVKEIRSNEQSGHRAVILALTASAIDTKETVLQSGMDDFVEKPINIENLRNKMAKLLLEGK